MQGASVDERAGVRLWAGTLRARDVGVSPHLLANVSHLFGMP